ncbi:FtsX-like permease family protein [Massilia sp. R2A-15]|uniref:ABC transporter permease n=1 Tax=Massilia sp. R2A-15 TaxID=3064278 RepID=UPI002732DB14|nr:FtsX-like permease family protein [Massilia sp. R2A-15]WLI89071.1 FtsX-like permease family protein [Massilia sp. R2A-15]
MSPQLLALRTLLLGRTRSVVAIILVAASLCALNIFAGNIASAHARLEYQAVVGERLGHLAITRAGAAFEAAEAQRIALMVEGAPGVASVAPQMRVAGIASAGQRSALFDGEGIGGKPGPKGVALSGDSARALGLRQGGSVTLSGVGGDAPETALQTQVAEIYSTVEFNASARSLLMPFEMAQAVRGTGRTERLVVTLADPKQLEAQRTAMRGLLRGAGIEAEVHTWQELSPSYVKARSAAELTQGSVAGVVIAVIAATIAATLSMNAFERRREVATLRALGMRGRAVFVMFAAEALWMAGGAAVIGVVGSGLIAWIANRAGLSWTAQAVQKEAPMLIELEFDRMLMAVGMVLVVALLAALAPAIRAARADVAEGLAG